MPLHLFLHLGIFVFVTLCGATDIPCTVTQDKEGTHYSVAEFNETDCEFQWINNYVIANQEEETDKGVLRKSDRTLVTSECAKQINYTRSCISERVKQTATCTSNCSRTFRVPDGGEVSYWVGPTVAISVVLPLLGLVVLVGLLVLVWYKFRNCIPSWLYTPVNKQDDSSMCDHV